MTVIMQVFVDLGFLTVLEKKTETSPDVVPVKQAKKGMFPPPQLVVEAAGQRYAQAHDFRY